MNGKPLGAFECSFSIQAAYFVQVCGELLRQLRLHDFHSVPKAAKPGVELIRQLDFRQNGKVLFIILAVMCRLSSKAVNHGVQKVVCETKVSP